MFDGMVNSKMNLGDERAGGVKVKERSEAVEPEPCAMRPGHATGTIPYRADGRQRDADHFVRGRRRYGETLALAASK